jgi:hypothetical protein
MCGHRPTGDNNARFAKLISQDTAFLNLFQTGSRFLFFKNAGIEGHPQGRQWLPPWPAVAGPLGRAGEGPPQRGAKPARAPACAALSVGQFDEDVSVAGLG